MNWIIAILTIEFVALLSFTILVHKIVKKDTAVVFNVKQCPCCKKQSMETIMRFQRRGPPQNWKTLATDLLALIRNATP